jgi:hypothetical protein
MPNGDIFQSHKLPTVLNSIFLVVEGYASTILSSFLFSGYGGTPTGENKMSFLMLAGYLNENIIER